MREFRLVEIFKVVVKWRKFIYLNVLLITFVSIILSLILPAKYQAQTRILPVLEGILSKTAPSITARLSSFMSFPGFATPADVYKGILSGREIKERVIKKLNLLKHFKTNSMEEALEKFNKNLNIEASIEGIITIEVIDRDPQLAAQIANTLVIELDRFNKETIMTRGKKTRIFLEKRLNEAKEELTAVEESLRLFQETHKVLNLEEELKSAVQAYADLKAKYISKEIEYNLLLNFANKNHPSVVEIENELKELKNQFKKFETSTNNEGFGAGFSVPFSRLPETSLTLLRLMREVEIKSKVYGFLIEQYEQAKILETKDTPTLQVIDRAVPPEKRIWPQRKRMVLLSFIISFMLSLIFVFLMEFGEMLYRDEKSDLEKILEILRKDLKLFRRTTRS